MDVFISNGIRNDVIKDESLLIKEWKDTSTSSRDAGTFRTKRNLGMKTRPREIYVQRITERVICEYCGANMVVPVAETIPKLAPVSDLMSKVTIGPENTSLRYYVIYYKKKQYSE